MTLDMEILAQIVNGAINRIEKIFNKKPIDYKTINHQNNPQARDDEVKALLADGWVLSGDAKEGKCPYSGETIYTQAMVKYEEASE